MMISFTETESQKGEKPEKCVKIRQQIHSLITIFRQTFIFFSSDERVLHKHYKNREIKKEAWQVVGVLFFS